MKSSPSSFTARQSAVEAALGIHLTVLKQCLYVIRGTISIFKAIESWSGFDAGVLINQAVDAVAWTSASAMSRSLFINKSWNVGLLGIIARVWFTLLLLTPLAVGLTEITIGIMYRRTSPSCTIPLVTWVLINGCVGLLGGCLTLLDIYRVQKVQKSAEDATPRDEEEGAPLKGGRQLDDDDANARARRSNLLGTNTVLAYFLIVITPTFRLIWMLYGYDLLYNVDPNGLLKFVPHINAAAEACGSMLYQYMFYYVQALTLGLIAAAFVCLLYLLYAVASCFSIQRTTTKKQ